VQQEVVMVMCLKFAKRLFLAMKGLGRSYIGETYLQDSTSIHCVQKSNESCVLDVRVFNLRLFIGPAEA